MNIIGGCIWLYNEHKNLHFDNKWEIYMGFANYEESGYNLDFILLTISS